MAAVHGSLIGMTSEDEVHCGSEYTLVCKTWCVMWIDEREEYDIAEGVCSSKGGHLSTLDSWLKTDRVLEATKPDQGNLKKKLVFFVFSMLLKNIFCLECSIQV